MDLHDGSDRSGEIGREHALLSGLLLDAHQPPVLLKECTQFTGTVSKAIQAPFLLKDRDRALNSPAPPGRRTPPPA